MESGGQPNIGGKWGAVAFGLVVAGAAAVMFFEPDLGAIDGALLQAYRAWLPWAGLGAVALYWALALALAGRAPAKGAVMPLFAPPPGISPPAARYVWRGGFDDRTTAAALVDMAVSGEASLEPGDSALWLQVNGSGESLPPAEKAMLAELGEPGQRVAVNGSEGGAMARAVRALKRRLYDEYAGAYLRAFRPQLIGGLVLSFLAALAVSLCHEQWFVSLGLWAWLAVWAAGCLFLAHRVFGYWRATASAFHGRLVLLKALALTAFAVPFLVVMVVVFNLTAEITGPRPLLFNTAILLLNPLFLLALRRPTTAGRRLVQAIEGYRMYLEKVEMPRAATEGALGKAGRELAYGVALGLEHDWSLRLEEALAGPLHGLP